MNSNNSLESYRLPLSRQSEPQRDVRCRIMNDKVTEMFRPERGDQSHFRVIDGNTHVWDVKTLWRLAEQHPVEEVPVSTIATGMLNDWFGGNPPSRAAMTVADRWAKAGYRPVDRAFPDRLAPGGRQMELWIWEAIMDASLDYPIVVDAEYKVMDGGHRLAKALLLGTRTIRCARMDPTPLPHVVFDSSVSQEDRVKYLNSLPMRPEQEREHRTS